MDAGLLRSSEPAAVEVDWKLRGKNPIWKRRAKTARRSSRCMPKASAPKFHQSNGFRGSAMPSWRSGRIHGFCVTGGHLPIAPEPTPSPRLWATAPGATPARLCEHTMRVFYQPSKPELSTWLAIGTFYLAPTPTIRVPEGIGDTFCQPYEVATGGTNSASFWGASRVEAIRSGAGPSVVSSSQKSLTIASRV